VQRLQLKPKAVKSYYEALGRFRALDVSHETAVRDAFQDLLKECGRQYGWTLVPEWPLKRAGQTTLRADRHLRQPSNPKIKSVFHDSSSRSGGLDGETGIK
jgi:hypothetical protein